MDEVLVGSEESAKIMRGIEGSWKKICDAHRVGLAEKD
jgi:hypothetical protein